MDDCREIKDFIKILNMQAKILSVWRLSRVGLAAEERINNNKKDNYSVITVHYKACKKCSVDIRAQLASSKYNKYRYFTFAVTLQPVFITENYIII